MRELAKKGYVYKIIDETLTEPFKQGDLVVALEDNTSFPWCVSIDRYNSQWSLEEYLLCRILRSARENYCVMVFSVVDEIWPVGRYDAL